MDRVGVIKLIVTLPSVFLDKSRKIDYAEDVSISPSSAYFCVTS